MKLSEVWNELKIGDVVSSDEFRSLCKTMGVKRNDAAPFHVDRFLIYRLKSSDAKETTLPSGLRVLEKIRDVATRNRKSPNEKAQTLPQPPASRPAQSPDLDDITIGRSIIKLIQKLETKVKEQNDELAQLVEEKAQLERQCRELKERLCQMNQQKSGSTISLHRLQELVNGGAH